MKPEIVASRPGFIWSPWTQHFWSVIVRVWFFSIWPLIWSGVSFVWPISDDLWSILASNLVADFSDLWFGQTETPNGCFSQSVGSSIQEMETRECCKYTKHAKKCGKTWRNEERNCLRSECLAEGNWEEMKADMLADLCQNFEVRIRSFSL